MIDDAEIAELLRKKGKHLYHREGQKLEFKEQFNLAGLADYFRDFAAFANNQGGYLVFGVTDSPRKAVGLNAKSAAAFENIDPEKITGFLLKLFSSSISWEQAEYESNGKKFGVFKVYPSKTKPVIAKVNEGKNQTIKSGDIYYRYGGRTQRIQYAELESIIRSRVESNNQNWMQLVNRIGSSGPSNVAVLSTTEAIDDNSDAKFVIDQALIEQIKFVQEGKFAEKEGAQTLRLVGEIQPVEKVEVERIVKENLFEKYPLSAMDLLSQVTKTDKSIKQNQIWQAIKDNNLKGNPDYSAYNFRNKRQQELYERTGKIASVTPCIYNQAAVDFLVKTLSKK